MAHITVGLVIIFGVVLLPVYLFLLGAFFGKPRAPKVAMLVLALPISLLVAIVAGFWVLGQVVTLFVV